MYTYEKNPYVKGEILIYNPEKSVILARLMYNDYAAEYEEPEQAWEEAAQDVCDALTMLEETK